MKAETYIQKSSNMFAENRLLKFACLVFATSSVISTFMSYSALKYQTTVIVPPQVNQRFWVQGNKASNEYVVEFARYVASLSLSYTFGIGKSQFSELLTLYHPSVMQEARKSYYALSERLDETRAAQFFTIQSIKQDEEKKRIELFGVQRTLINEKPVEEVNKTYEIKYTVEAGKFQVLRIGEKELPVGKPKQDQEK